jgi:hypothetical protein
MYPFRARSDSGNHFDSSDDPQFWDVEETLVCITTHGGFLSWYIDLCRQGVAAHPAGWYQRWFTLRHNRPGPVSVADDSQDEPVTNEYDPHLPGSQLFLKRELAAIEVRRQSFLGRPQVILVSQLGREHRFTITAEYLADEYGEMVLKVYPRLYRAASSW